MNFTHLGRTGLRVSRLCLGTMNFGPETDEPTSFEIMDRAHEVGINFFDSANVYGRSQGRGATEQIVGRWFAQGAGRRDRTVLATKLYVDMGEWPNEGRLSALNIRRACDASLRRLQTDYIDLYQMHHIDRRTPWDEIWEAMEVLRAQGKIIYVGSSNFAGWHIAAAQGVARERNFMGLVSEQSLYNLLARHIELEVLPAAADFGVGIIPWSPLQSGLLGGVVRKEREGSRRNQRWAGAGEDLRGGARSVRGSLRITRRGAGYRRPGVAVHPSRGHCADHRTPHHRAVRRVTALARDHAGRRDPQGSRHDIPRPPPRPGRLRLVAGTGLLTAIAPGLSG